MCQTYFSVLSYESIHDLVRIAHDESILRKLGELLLDRQACATTFGARALKPP